MAQMLDMLQRDVVTLAGPFLALGSHVPSAQEAPD